MGSSDKIKKLEENINKSQEIILKEQEKIKKWKQEIKTCQDLEIKGLLNEMNLSHEELKNFLKSYKKQG